MSFLSDLFKEKNETSKWVENESVEISIDLSNNKFSTVSLNEEFEKISFLGPGKRAEFSKKSFNFLEKGIGIDINNDNKIEAFAIYFRNSYIEKMKPYKGKVIYNEKIIDLTGLKGKDELIMYFGEPYRQEEDEEETIMYYEFEDHEWQIELTPEGEVNAMIICRPSLFDPEAK